MIIVPCTNCYSNIFRSVVFACHLHTLCSVLYYTTEPSLLTHMKIKSNCFTIISLCNLSEIAFVAEISVLEPLLHCTFHNHFDKNIPNNMGTLVSKAMHFFKPSKRGDENVSANFLISNLLLAKILNSLTWLSLKLIFTASGHPTWLVGKREKKLWHVGWQTAKMLDFFFWAWQERQRERRTCTETDLRRTHCS